MDHSQGRQKKRPLDDIDIMICLDPKQIQGDLNNMSFEDKKKISDRAYQDHVKAVQARKLENEKEMKQSIKWREIFGDEFPKYED